MLYAVLKIIGQPAIRIFCRKIIVNRPELLNEKGPLLLACNHPNSFLDAIILNLLFKQTVYSLARGDAFINGTVSKILRALKIFPVYRTSEGVENLSENYRTFNACIEIFQKNSVVSIFSEGKCENEWRLRPLKKGTARLALKCWDEGIPLKVLPAGLNYSSFNRSGKYVYINFGEMITCEKTDRNKSDGLRNITFNGLLKKELEQLVFEIDKEDKQKLKSVFTRPVSLIKKILLLLPATTGWLLNAPLYVMIKSIARYKFKSTVHYDSVIFGLLVIIYPFYVIAASLLLFLLTKSPAAFLLILFLPFTAWSYVQLKAHVSG